MKDGALCPLCGGQDTTLPVRSVNIKLVGGDSSDQCVHRKRRAEERRALR